MSERTFILVTMICFDDIPGANFSNSRSQGQIMFDLKHNDGNTVTKELDFSCTSIMY
jgi:hypothetical protein